MHSYNVGTQPQARVCDLVTQELTLIDCCKKCTTSSVAHVAFNLSIFPSVLGVNEKKIDFIALNTRVAAMVSLEFTEKVGSFADDVSDSFSH